MKIQNQNLFLLESNALSSARIVAFLEDKFPNSLKISTFDNGNDLLKSVDSETAIVILDYDLKGESGNLVLKQIKQINYNTEVIILASDDDLASAIDAYRKGARSYVSKNKNTFSRLQSILSSIVYYPASIVQRFLGINQLLAIFIVEVVYIGLVVFLGFKIFS
jgi:DNA-binding NarL/FixJ family response regulator